MTQQLIPPAPRRRAEGGALTIDVHERQALAVNLGGANWLGKLLYSIFVRRWPALSADRVSDHLLRDIGLQRTAGQIRRRPR